MVGSSSMISILFIVRSFLLHWQCDDKPAPLPHFAFYGERAAMGFDKVARDGQPQPTSLYLGAWHAEVPFEDTLVIAWVDATSEITHKHCDVMFVLLFSANDDTSIFRRIAYGIAQQIGEHPSYLITIYI